MTTPSAVGSLQPSWLLLPYSTTSALPKHKAPSLPTSPSPYLKEPPNLAALSLSPEGHQQVQVFSLRVTRFSYRT